MADNTNTVAPGRHRAAFGFVIVTVFLDMMAIGVIIPVLPNLINGLVGTTTADGSLYVGLFAAIWGLMQFFASPVLGAISDAVGRRPVIILSNVGLGLSYVITALATNLWVLLFGRVLSGVTSASVSTAFAYVTDTSEPEKRAGRFGLLGAAFGFGFIIGPVLGGALGKWDINAPFILAAVLSFANALYGFFILPESLKPEDRDPFTLARANPFTTLTRIFRYGRVVGLAFVAFLSHFAHMVLQSTFVLYALHRYQWEEDHVGYTLGLVGVLSAIVQGALVGPVVKRIGERRAVLIGLSAAFFGMLIYGLAPTGWVFLLGLPVMAFWGLSNASLQGLMTQQVSRREQGRLQGSVTSLQSVAVIVAPLLYASLVFPLSISAVEPVTFFGTSVSIPVYVPGAVFFVSCLILLAAFWLAWHATRDIPPHTPEQAAAIPEEPRHAIEAVAERA